MLAAFFISAAMAKRAGCSCDNAVPLEQIMDTLERSLSSQVAGHERARALLLAAARRQVWAWSAGRSSSLRLHLTGPSGVGKSFMAKLLANSYFEESEVYTGYRAAGAVVTTTATTLALTKAGAILSSLGPLTAAGVAAPIAAATFAVAAVAGWRLVEFGDSYWTSEPRPFPTQCGVSWWKFGTPASETEARRDVDRALTAASRVVSACASAVLVFEDVNRLPASALQGLERLTEPILRVKSKKVTFTDVAVVLTSDLYAVNASTNLVLEEAMPMAQAEAVVEAQSHAMWGDHGAPPSWWTRAFATLPLPPLDDDDLVNAVRLYLHNDVTRLVRDALRYEFAAGRKKSWFPYSAAAADEWAGSVAFDERVLDHVKEFVRRGPDDWRCHAITHFHTTVVEPTIDDAIAKLLHHGPSQGALYTSSLLMTLEPRLVDAGTPLERHYLDVRWDLVDLQEP